MTPRRLITRREFLSASIAVAAGGLLASCGAPETAVEPTVAPEQAAPTTAPAEKEAVVTPDRYTQNPMWDSEVASGSLPPVEERLPSSPVIAPRSGQYGGVPKGATTSQRLRNGLDIGGGDRGHFGAVRLNEDFSYSRNVVEEVEYSNDNKTLTVRLQPGMKWSDGEPWTATDWEWHYHNHLFDTDITPTPPRWSKGTDGGIATFTKIDDLTFRIEWTTPAGNFVRSYWAHPGRFQGLNARPAHFMQQFHLKTNPNADTEAKALGYADWKARYIEKAHLETNPAGDSPHIWTYSVENVAVDAVTYKPNPYFWMVDQDGKQLPYFDGAVVDRVADSATVSTKLFTGELDYGWFSFADYTTFKQEEATGPFKAYLWNHIRNAQVYNFNWSYDDEVWRNIFQDVRFRRAMSVALNRQEMNDVCYFGMCEPGQFTAHITSRAYKPEYAQAWAQYDPDLANELLDEIGLEWDSAGTRRTLPDGRPMVIDLPCEEGQAYQCQIDLAVEKWKAVGVEVNYKYVSGDLLRQTMQANQCMMSVWGGDEHADLMIGAETKFFGVRYYWQETCTSIPWALWWDTGGEQGEEPIEEIKMVMQWHRDWNATGNWDYIDKILAWQAENLITIGTVNDPPKPIAFNKDMRNVPEKLFHSWDNGNAPYAYLECVYFDR
jgi:peptide/nickel transport system substrate-binding protein